jgi:amino acid transporter
MAPPGMAVSGLRKIGMPGYRGAVVSEYQLPHGPAKHPRTDREESAAAQEGRLQHHLGFWSLTAIGFSNILGSGWLFAAMYAAQTAGPAALLSWVGAGLLSALVALVMVELGASRPEGGGTARWPLYASGRLVGTMVGWSVLLSVGGTAAEITAIMQYAAHYLPGLYNGHTLTFAGLGLALGLSLVLTALNWFGCSCSPGSTTRSRSSRSWCRSSP